MDPRGSCSCPQKRRALHTAVQTNLYRGAVDDLQAGLAGADIYLSVHLKEFWFKGFSLNLFYLFCVCVLFYFILKVNQYWPNSLNHLFSTENEVSVQVHEGPQGNWRVEMRASLPCPFFHKESVHPSLEILNVAHQLPLPPFDKASLAL